MATPTGQPCPPFRQVNGKPNGSPLPQRRSRSERPPRTALTQVAHCTHTGCPLHSHRLPTGLTQVARCAHTAAHCTHAGCPRCAHTAAHCTHTGCPLDSPRLPTTHARANLFYCARQARPVSLTDAHCSHTGSQVAHSLPDQPPSLGRRESPLAS